MTKAANSRKGPRAPKSGTASRPVPIRMPLSLIEDLREIGSENGQSINSLCVDCLTDFVKVVNGVKERLDIVEIIRAARQIRKGK